MKALETISQTVSLQQQRFVSGVSATAEGSSINWELIASAGTAGLLAVALLGALGKVLYRAHRGIDKQEDPYKTPDGLPHPDDMRWLIKLSQPAANNEEPKNK